ncbi:gas vesicle protein G [Actinophytocola xinjiangensis]|uniref:Gas vesicle protein G n=1 Tax=Actinophytocola xinjiangensis TaxID=485602 RepID=A0A7Z0WT70_9PSEU|nr:gas vesicle protein GvpG [Actinophytocola xinjiangensis]OLF14414.1 gas vesicle protein G [Actinophytocola xinjiangensis]
MGLLSMIVGLPLAPVRGVVKLAEVVQRQVDEELRHPMSVRRELEELDRREAEGELTPAEETEAQQRILDRMTEQNTMER